MNRELGQHWKTERAAVLEDVLRLADSDPPAGGKDKVVVAIPTRIIFPLASGRVLANLHTTEKLAPDLVSKATSVLSRRTLRASGGGVGLQGGPRVGGGGAAPAGGARGRRATAERAAGGSAWGFVSGGGGCGWRLGGTVTPCHAWPCPTWLGCVRPCLCQIGTGRVKPLRAQGNITGLL